MNLSRDALTELREVTEDTVEYACDKHRVSGEAAWSAVYQLSELKLREIRGLL